MSNDGGAATREGTRLLDERDARLERVRKVWRQVTEVVPGSLFPDVSHDLPYDHWRFSVRADGREGKGFFGGAFSEDFLDDEPALRAYLRGQLKSACPFSRRFL